MYLLQLNKGGEFAEPSPSSIMQFIYMKTCIQMTYQRTLKCILFYKSANLHKYTTYNNPQTTTRNWTTSNPISEAEILGSNVEFTRLGKTYTTNLIDKHRLTYPTDYTSHYSYVQQRKKSATILKWVGNIWVP